MRKNCFAKVLFLLLTASLAAASAQSSNFARGEELFLQNKPEEAVTYLKKAYSKKENPKVYEYLSLSYFQLGMYEEGIAVVNAGMKVSGTDKKLLAFNAGNAAFLAGKYEAAENWYTTAIMADGSYSSPVINRANTRIYEGKIADARTDYMRFLELEPNDYRRPEIEEILKEIDNQIAQEEERERARLAEEKRIAEEEARLAEEQKREDAFAFERTEVELDSDLRLRRRRTPKPYVSQNRLFTFVDPDKANAPEIIDTTDVSPMPEEPITLETVPLDDGPEAVDAGEPLSDDAGQIVDAAVRQADKAAKKNRSEVRDYKEEKPKKRAYSLPPIDCLAAPDFTRSSDLANEIKTTSKKLVDTLKSFGVEPFDVGNKHW